ncbi:hypothetical protein C8F01DRAFT_439702 [Mycena amicta]|nr:hypothetical protein C8F01DRAFT_439702 [Mycena amicta]
MEVAAAEERGNAGVNWTRWWMAGTTSRRKKKGISRAQIPRRLFYSRVLSPTLLRFSSRAHTPSSRQQPHKYMANADTTASSSQLTPDNVPLQQPTPVRTLVPLGSQGPAQTKKFSAVNINKKFLEKNSSTSSSSPATAGNSAAKMSSPVSRPTSQSTAHSRLVTTKLTTAPQGLSTGPGWSRPSSATPPASTTPSINGAGPGDASTSTAPSAIQSQSRPTRPRDNANAANKLAWGSPKLNQLHPNVASQMEFPTAAEVAAAPRKSKPTLADRNAASKEATAAKELAAAASKQARMEEADTFRGVHLDPNAHHWDEMEEDDDNFLDGVIEFGDGRQYKIEATDLPTDASSATLVTADSLSSLPSPLEDPQSNGPVSKEERFADDFDRSWPRSRASPSVSTRDLPAVSSVSAAAQSPVSPALSMVHSPQELLGSRGMLFNERSNKLEPYNKVGANQKRGSDGVISPTEARGRDVQLLQNRGRGFGGPNERQSRMPPPQPASRAPSNVWKEAEETRGRQLPAMGPPPVPAQGTRQRPPHFPPNLNDAPPRRTSTSRDSRHRPPSEAPSSARRPPSQSPSLSHASATAHSPIATLSQLSTTELNEARKDVMQTAAARAKARRQQEEEEREKEKERARRKAAELEEKMKALDAEKAKVQDAEKARAQRWKSSNLQPRWQTFHLHHLSLSRRSLFCDDHQKCRLKRPSSLDLLFLHGGCQRTPIDPPSQPAEPQVSWRSKPSTVAAIVPAQFEERHTPAVAPKPAFAAAPTVLDQAESLGNDPAEELEVVDFSDLGKFVGVSDEPPPPPLAVSTVIPRPPRPSASDFFDDRPDTVPSPSVEKPATTTWRRHEADSRPIESQDRPQLPLLQDLVAPSSSVDVLSPVNRTPRSQHKEAAMSTLDDVMSRIKGAIDTMQTTERERRSPEVSAAVAVSRPPPFQTPVQARWVPPAFRPRPVEPPEPREEIVTGYEPPRSPKHAWNTFITRLPKTSQALEPVNRKQLSMFNRQMPFRWDVLSFDPPVEGMSKREFTVNEILFRRVPFKGKSKFKVLLPSGKIVGPKVSVPPTPTKPSTAGTFGRSPPDGLSTWRKPPAVEAGLNTMSRSPPPELPSHPNAAPIPSPDVFGTRSRPEPKMPAGSVVAFYRDSVESDGKIPVNFIVNSELDGTPSKPKPSIFVSSPGTKPTADLLPFIPRANGLAKSTDSGMPSLISNSKAESKSPDDSTDRTPITPPSHHTASWARTSLGGSGKDASRGPDPEHLKAVWSQSSNKATPVNSLEGIADDLTAIPFTLQEVKSEDGGTPPPTTTTSTASSRMSLHDVTRAFQQVPASSSSSNVRAPISPPSTSAPVARPPPASYPYPLPPPPNQMLRPTYSPYSPMMGSQTPSVIYPMAPSPVPGRVPMNGHAPLYSQPVWMAQNPNMMRPPYPQLLPYPTPGGTPMYAPQPQPMQGQPQQPNGPRGRGIPPQNVMYPASPILMHAPPMPVGYMTMGRGQMRNDNGHQPMQQQQHHPPSGHTPGFNPVSSTSFVRPAW